MPDSLAASHSRPHGWRVVQAGALMLVVLLGACSGPAYVDMRREAGNPATVGSASLDSPTVCYSVRRTTPQEVLALAREVCARTDRVPLYQSSDWLTCTLMQPRRALFKCVAPGTAGANRIPPDRPGRASSGAVDGSWGTGGGGFDDWSGGIYPDGRPPSAPRL